jgi:hypothetical protein
MKLHSVLAVATFLAAAATMRDANAQGQVYNARQGRSAAMTPQRGGGALAMRQGPVGRPVEMQGPGAYSGGVVGEHHPGEFVSDGGYGEGCGPGGCGPDGCGAGGCGTGGCGYGDGCCDTCGGEGCDGECFYRGGLGCDLFGMVCPPGRYFFTADYLYVRANFSEAVAFLVQENNQQGIATDTFHSFDFDYESSYRLGGGYRLCNCGEEFRVYFTRLSSFADAFPPDGAVLPFEVNAPPGGTTAASADVDVKSYDFEFAKTIPLGGALGCGCGDACGGCGDGCGSNCACPAWDITWSGGLRFADVEWSRGYSAADTTGFVVTEALSAMNFEGGGVKLGLEGRRYFCGNGCLSVYLKGDISLLMGDVDIITARRTDDPSTPTDTDTLITQTISNRQIIPVTEIEAGLTGHLTCNTSLTTGYMLSAWHDLGFRDEFQGFSNGAAGSLLETNYDDANILGFDGFFARLEVAY